MKRIEARKSFFGEFTIPGDKSITHRAIMFNSSVDGTSTITGALIAEDCLSTCNCMRALGAEITIGGTTVYVKGVSKFNNETELDCGNSGTTVRLLTGLLAGKNVEAKLTGDFSLCTRPMGRVTEPLSKLGAKAVDMNGYLPIYVYPKSLTGADVTLNVSSAQVKSAILLAGLSAEGKTTVTEPVKSRDHTERMLSAMGAKIAVDGNTVSIEKSELHAVDVHVPADISSASYFMALGALLGQTICKNVGINPTRTGILKAFDKLGVRYVLQNKHLSCGEDVADILVEKSALKAITITAEEVPALVDELPLIALLCAFADGESKITGAGELRVKESDRIRTTTEMINALGGDCQELSDGFIIRGKTSLKGGCIINSYGDHRIAMAGTVGLMASQNSGVIKDETCCAISFPDFYKLLEK